MNLKVEDLKNLAIADNEVLFVKMPADATMTDFEEVVNAFKVLKLERAIVLSHTTDVKKMPIEDVKTLHEELGKLLELHK